MIAKEEGQDVSLDVLYDYANPDTDRYHLMLDRIKEEMGFTTLQYNRLDDMLSAVGIPEEQLCTYCWNGKE